MSERGVAILMSTHTLEVAQEMCDRISIILKGKIIARGTVDELRALAGGDDEQLTSVFLKLTGGSGAAGDRRDRVTAAGAFPLPLLLPHALVVAQPRAPARARRSARARCCSAASAWSCSPRCSAGSFWLTAQLAGLRGARRLPAAPRPVVAVPDVSVVPRLQRRRDRALDVLSRPTICGCCWRRRSRRGACSTRASSRTVVAGVVDGRRLSGAGAARRRRGALRAAVFYLTAVADRRAVRRRSRSRPAPAVTLLLVNVFPARRARDMLMLMGLLFAASLVMLLRFIQPEQLLRVESLPDVTDFFATLQSPVTPLLPSFWAGETLFASLQGGRDLLHAAALWTTALAFTVVLRRGAASAGISPATAGRRRRRKARFTQFRALDAIARRAAAVDRPPAAAGQGSEDLPARRQPVVAAAAAARAGAALSLQLPRARSQRIPVHERLHEERLRVPEPRAWPGS